MQIDGAYAQPVAFVSWGVPAARLVPHTTRWTIAGILPHLPGRFFPALLDLHFLRRRWLRAGSAPACDSYSHAKFGTTLSRREQAVQCRGGECFEFGRQLAVEPAFRRKYGCGDDYFERLLHGAELGSKSGHGDGDRGLAGGSHYDRFSQRYDSRANFAFASPRKRNYIADTTIERAHNRGH